VRYLTLCCLKICLVRFLEDLKMNKRKKELILKKYYYCYLMCGAVRCGAVLLIKFIILLNLFILSLYFLFFVLLSL
jgi:hypothetical protein